MDKGERRASVKMTWRKPSDDSIVELAEGGVFFCFGNPDPKATHVLVVVDVVHMFLSSIEAIEARSVPVEKEPTVATMRQRQRLAHFKGWYEQAANRGVVDPVDLDAIIVQVFDAWADDIASYELLCLACQSLDAQGKATISNAISDVTLEEPGP